MTAKRLSRRDFLKATAGAMGAGLVAACAAPTVAPPAAEQAPAEGAAVAEKPVGLEGQEGVLWGLQYDPHVAAYERLADLFFQQTGAKLTVEPQAWPIPPKVIAALSAGTQPDVACIMGEQLLPLHMQKALLPCSDLVYKHMNVDPDTAFYGDAIGAYTWQGEIWGVPTEANGVGDSVNVPSEDVIALGLEDQYPPLNGEVFFESYESMWELAKVLQVEEDGRVVRWGLSSKGWDDISYLGIVRSLLDPEGTDWWDLDAQKFNINTDAGITAMKLFVETPVKMGIETELAENHVDACLAGKVALGRGNGTPSLPMGWDLGFSFVLAGAPKVIPPNPPIFVGEGGWGFVAPKESLHPDISVEFLRMMVTHEGQLEYAKIYGGAHHTAWAALRGVYDHFEDPDPEGHNVIAAKLRQFELLPRTRFEGEGFGYIAEIEKAVAEICSEVRQQNLTAEEGAQQLQERFEAQYQQYLEDLKEYQA